ncbi:hypothetical protein [Parasitella parasitica]|uniref:Uncharacterized protein n=1 Tax=Parasitella parasitica TaxID=35722 RepID=A0A0B7NEJ1_9FUNG|nr:hypothetical protein [Parasitella parasitica]
MAKERKPIATRTRNRTKSQNGNSKSSVTSFSPPVKAANIKTPPTVKPFTKGVNRAKPKQSHKHQEDGSENKGMNSLYKILEYNGTYNSNLDMYLQELDRLPLSFVRGATVEKRRDILRNDNDECDYYSRFTLDDDEHDNTKEQLSFLLNNSMAPDAESNTNYFTCLHRAFIKKRYLSDQECMHLAKYVNCDFYTRSLQELAMLIKDEFYMYRIDFTQRHLNHIRTMNITEEAFLQNEKGLEKVLEQQSIYAIFGVAGS